MVKGKISFITKDTDGNWMTKTPIVYVKEGKSKKDILSDKELFWQAIEIEGFDNTEILVEVVYEEDGNYLDRDEGVMTSHIVRTNEPSDYIVWGNAVPHIFKIDREKSSFNIKAI